MYKAASSRLLAMMTFGALLGIGAPAWPAPPVSETAPQAFTHGDFRPALPAKPARPLPSERSGLSAMDIAFAPQVALSALDRSELLARDREDRRLGRTKLLRYGVGRPVELRSEDGSWLEVQGGALWISEIVSGEALGLRLHFSEVRLPAGAELAVYAPSLEREAPAVRSGRPARAAAEFHDAARSSEARSFWTATVPGERARIEYFLPNGVPSRLPFRVDRLQHIYLDPVAETGASWSKDAGPCHNDVSCSPEWGATANSVAGIGFAGSDSLFCTGQLLATQRRDLTPYFLTANHCLSSAEEADSLEAFWFYQTPACGERPPSLSTVPTSVGATLLTTHPASDFTLLMIEGALPEGVSWAGWNSTPVRNGTGVTAIHHPSGDFKRISFGSKGESSACEDNNLIRINWSDGPTEPGSSGSGVFRNDTQQLVGQLFFGPSSCEEESFDCYGAFASTFPRIRGRLREGTDDNMEQNDTCNRPRAARPGRYPDRIIRATDQDFYRINLPQGRTLHVELTFAHNNGDVDARLFNRCGGDVIASSEGTTDTETLTFTNTGRTAIFTWQVYLASDTRNAYTMNVSVE